MKEGLTEWECSKIANNLDRIEDYRGSKVPTTYIGGDLTENMSEWDALQVANNLDRIDSYRRGNGILADSESFIGFLVGVPIFIMFLIYAVQYMFF